MRSVIISCFICALLFISPALANPFEKLVMPGKISEAHKKYENDCNKCHSSFDQDNQNSLCIDCHKDVGLDIDKKQGLHGINSDGNKCDICHSEHKGREYNIISLDKETFNHNKTDFPIKGLHRNVKSKCDACHKKDKKFREAPNKCFDCHKKDDAHNKTLGNKCGDCHNEKSWSDMSFDHQKTKFKLTGKHQKVTCDACHTNKSYKQTPSDCFSCHVINDVHNSKIGTNCSNCHNSEGWKKISFDHNKETKFKLTGKHKQTRCEFCHKSNVFTKNAGSKCIDCHRDDDKHKGVNGVKCESCHSVKNWDVTEFNHNKDTDFKLTGPHKKLQCEHCHKEAVQKGKKRSSCYDCHKVNDVHNEQLGKKCDNCHNENSWQEKIIFNHDASSFPLIGIHATVTCGECHESSAFKDDIKDCISCHKQEDYHKQALGDDCDSCHNPNGWGFWQFDHDLESDFKLDGEHKDMECSACHTKAISISSKIKLSKDCILCHNGDDVHEGSFGRKCGECHNTSSFKGIKLFKK